MFLNAEELARKELSVLCNHAAWQPQFDEIAQSRDQVHTLNILKMLHYDGVLRDLNMVLGPKTRQVLEYLRYKVT